MDCQKLHQEIAELGHKYGDVELQYEKAEESGHGESLKKALFVLDEAADGLLEKYLPDFQEQFGDKLGIGEAHIEGEVRGLGNSVVSMPWGECFAITKEGLFSVVEDENGGLSRGGLIVAGDYLDVFPMSDGRIMLPTSNKINVLEKKNGGYTLCKELNVEKISGIDKVVAMPHHGWVINASTEVCMLDEDINGELAFSEQINLTDIDPGWKRPAFFLPLSDDEILISELSGGTGVFTKNGSGGLTFVKNIFDIRSPNIKLAGEVVPMAEGKWFVRDGYDMEEGYFLYRNGSASQTYELSAPISKMVNASICFLSHLSQNEFLIEDFVGNVFVFAMQADGSLERKNRIKEGVGVDEFMPHIENMIPLTDDVWLLSKGFQGWNYVLRRRVNDEFELGEMLDGLDYSVRGAIPISKGRYLLSDAGDKLRRNEVFPMNYDLSILNLCHTFKDVEDLKSNLDEIIEVGNS